MESTGTRLKKLRLEKGISLEQVNKKTKIHLNILRAIEEDSLVGLSPVYIKGFLKIYCNFLGVAPQEFISDYTQITPGMERFKSASEVKPKSFLKTHSKKLLVFKSTHIKTAFKVVILIVCIIVLVYLVKSVAGWRSHVRKPVKTPVIAAPVKIDKNKVEITEPNKTKIAPSGVKERHPDNAAQANVFNIRLVMRAKNDCWVRLKVDGKLVFQDTLKKGRSDSWQAKDKMELSLGNAQAVELEINGKLIPPLGRKRQSLKNILITKDGVSQGR
jgi:cytoskeletal protein RodZ